METKLTRKLAATVPSKKMNVYISDDTLPSKIGTCLVQKLLPQPSPQSCLAIPRVNLFFNSENNYLKVQLYIPHPKNVKIRGTDNERVLETNVPFAHSHNCPHLAFSCLSTKFDLSSPSYPNTTFSVCGLLVDHDGMMLLTKRSPDLLTFPRSWGFPTAIALESTTDPTECLLNAFKQEVGLVLQRKEKGPEIVIDDEDEAEESGTDEIENDGEKKEAASEYLHRFKRQTRFQSKMQDLKMKGESLPPNQSKLFSRGSAKKSEILLTKGTAHLVDDPRCFFAFESVFPTDITINYPQYSSVIICYLLSIKESWKDLQLSQDKAEIDYCSWMSLEALASIIKEPNINSSNTEFGRSVIDTAVSYNHNSFSISNNTLIGVYPNALGEGIAEPYVAAIRELTRRCGVNVDKKI